MQPFPDSPEHHHQRSDFIRSIVQRRREQVPPGIPYKHGAPRSIVQFWHNAQQVPSDVEECIDSWRRWTAHGFRHQLFDVPSAKAFISQALDFRHERAFERCYHPAMQADYFRLCYLYVEGGFYVDADDVCLGNDIDFLFVDGRLKVQPLCYDLDTAMMVEPALFLQECTHQSGWIFYFNNNPLIASSGHPVIEQALRRSTNLLEFSDKDVLPEIQDTTGPGNLSKVIFEMGKNAATDDDSLVILQSWESIAVSKWPLSYRSDARNWRLSNQRVFVGSEG